MTLCGRRTLRSEFGVAPVPAEVRPLRPRMVWLFFEVLGSTVASLLVSFPRLVRQAFERLEPCEGKLSRTVLRGLGGSNPARLLDRSYRSLVKMYHPGRFPSDSAEKAEAERQIRNINEAYSVLSKPARRASYDTRLHSHAICCTETKPEHCSKCGKPTGYWGTVKRAAVCHRCTGTIL
jgi:hypothetical protein